MMKLSGNGILLRSRGILLTGLVAGFGLGLGLCAEEFFELGPIHYSEAEADNAVSGLTAKRYEDGARGAHELNFLENILKELDVPVESQVLVYSKTSVQKKRIFPRLPRALYFSDSTYVGYVPGGDVEVITHDPKLGLVFYMINVRDADPDVEGGGKGYHVMRKNSCLSCHVSSETGGVPGLFLRSVVTDDQGEVDFEGDSYFVNDETPLDHRWGGWYVTGNWSGISHMGNDFHGKSKLEKLEDVKGLIDVKKYLRETSDVAALLVLEHQCKVHTLLVASKMQYERAIHLEESLRRMGSEIGEDSAAMRTARLSAEEIVGALTFCDEAVIGGYGIQGNEAFERVFTSRAKLSDSGKHLRKFRLYERLFKYRCSYMIHSEAFLALPEVIQRLVFQRLHEVLTAESVPKGYEHLQSREKVRILEILKETTQMNMYVK